MRHNTEAVIMTWRRSSCLLAVWMLIVACEVLAIENCLVALNESDAPCLSDGLPVLPNSDLRIRCTATEVTATFTYNGSDFTDRVVDYGVAWICQSESGGEKAHYRCIPPLLLQPNVEISLNITGSGGWRSSCRMQGCVTHNDYPHRIPSNKCEIPGPATDSTTVDATTVTGAIATVTNQTTTVTEDDGKIQDGSIDMLITKVLAPLIGVLIMLILLVLVVIVPLVSVIHLRMRNYSCKWQAYGNPELPFDPHYAPVDIEKPSFNPTPTLSLLSVNMFQTLHMARTNNENLRAEQLSVHSNIHCNSSDSCSTLDTHDTGEESGNESIGSVLSEITVPHTSLDDEDTVCKTVSESSYQTSSVPYIQHAPLLRSQSLKDDYQDNLHNYVDSSPIENRGGDVPCDTSDSLHFWEHNSVPLPSLLAPFPSVCTETTVQLDKAYVSSESGYIQSHDMNYSTAQSLFIEEGTNPDHDTSNQSLLGDAVEQPTQMPTVILDNESIKSMDSSLNCYDAEVHTQTDSEGEEVDILEPYESDTINYGEHHGYIEQELHSNTSIITETCLVPFPSDIDLDFIPGLSGAVRPTSIDIRLASDYTPSDLSSGYITTSCTSYDDGQRYNIMDLLFQQKLKDVKELDTS